MSDLKKSFETSFETADDFSDFYITPQGYLNTSFHGLCDTLVHSGNYAHRAWITDSNPPSTETQNNNHRGYPSIQLYKTIHGSYTTPCLITLWVWLNVDLYQNNTDGNDGWFSFATLTCDDSDQWDRTILVNLSYDGYVHLMHVPEQGKQTHIFQANNIQFPQKEWVELKIYLDFTEDGYAKVWQNNKLVSYARVENVENQLAQAHFGLYCSPNIQSGVVYNDDLKIEEVAGE